VAAIAEAAAESIGACGLLVRVGAYFHDNRQDAQADYFVENQAPARTTRRMVPAMSTLIIIAHVKDGADLADSTDLPNRSSTLSNSITAPRWLNTLPPRERAQRNRSQRWRSA